MRSLPCLSLLLLFASTCVAGSTPAPTPVRCALPLLGRYLPKFRGPRASTRIAPARAPAAAPATRELWAWDLTVMPPGFRRVTASLRAAGGHCLVYVEDAEWGRTVDQAAVDTILSTFESRTPRHPDKGIADVDREAFGEIPPGLDGETRVTLLFTRMGRFNGQGFDGFFNSFDTLTEQTAWKEYQQHSNETDILYLNTDGNPPASDYMLSVLSHELVHLVAHPFDPDEVGWIGETLGEAGMLLCGYDTDQAHARRYASRPSTPLVTEPYVSYGACLLLAANFVDHQPPGFLKRLTAEPAEGIEGLEKTLSSFGPSDGFPGLFEKWVAGNLVSGLGSASPDLAYASLSTPPMAATTVAAGGLAETSGRLQATGVRYLKFAAAGSYRLHLAASGPGAMLGLAIRSPASPLPDASPLTARELAGLEPIQAREGDCIAVFGLAPGVYSYRLSVEAAGAPR
ncbi:MAG: hypothetical protein HY303_12190 [Candidatus Wallbacteria bacterium]|nr:hypothetical protein [Candidatus Wallbacteria bacterium]